MIKESFGRGLYLLTFKTGQFWRFRYRFEGKEKMISLGSIEFFALDEAIKARDRARELLQQGIDPSTHRQKKPFGSRLAKGLKSLS